MTLVLDTSDCPCRSGKSFQDCCQPCLQGSAAATAEVLMRSRYTAYVIEDEPYLLASWHPVTRPPSLDFDPSARPQWLGLVIRRYSVSDENHAVVEFVARYKINGRGFRMHETSRFERINGGWYYLDGEVS